MLSTYELLIEIDKKKKKVQNSPDTYLKKSHQVRKNLRGLADVHSFWLENPDLRKRILEEQKESDARRLKQRSRKYVKHIVDAWNYLSRVDDGNGHYNFLDPNTIIKLGELIGPNNQGFRSGRVRINRFRFIPPNYVKVPELVDKFCYELKQSDYHPIEAAAMVHLELTGIQPFVDGNKRVSRLLQDKILDCYDYPPAFIHSGERQVYLDLLDQALIAKQDNDLVYQRPFFDYIAGKVNTALDEIIDDLKIN